MSVNKSDNASCLSLVAGANATVLDSPWIFSIENISLLCNVLKSKLTKRWECLCFCLSKYLDISGQSPIGPHPDKNAWPFETATPVDRVSIQGIFSLFSYPTSIVYPVILALGPVNAARRRHCHRVCDVCAGIVARHDNSRCWGRGGWGILHTDTGAPVSPVALPTVPPFAILRGIVLTWGDITRYLNIIGRFLVSGGVVDFYANEVTSRSASQKSWNRKHEGTGTAILVAGVWARREIRHNSCKVVLLGCRSLSVSHKDLQALAVLWFDCNFDRGLGGNIDHVVSHAIVIPARLDKVFRFVAGCILVLDCFYGNIQLNRVPQPRYLKTFSTRLFHGEVDHHGVDTSGSVPPRVRIFSKLDHLKEYYECKGWSHFVRRYILNSSVIDLLQYIREVSWAREEKWFCFKKERLEGILCCRSSANIFINTVYQIGMIVG